MAQAEGEGGAAHKLESCRKRGYRSKEIFDSSQVKRCSLRLQFVWYGLSHFFSNVGFNKEMVSNSNGHGYFRRSSIFPSVHRYLDTLTGTFSVVGT